MRKSSAVKLTVVAAIGIAAQAQQRPDPCQSATFNAQACSEAVQRRGYCFNGQWVRMKYSYPYPYYYDRYQAYSVLVGASTPLSVGACGAPGFLPMISGHGTPAVARYGFGGHGAGQAGG
jgi:hypothetical protein